MKVLFVINSLEAGGKERQAVELVKGLSQMEGYECELVILKDKISYLEIYATNCKLYRLNKQTTSKIGLIIKLFYIIKNSKPHIIQSWDIQSSAYVCLFAFLFRIPFINYGIRYGKKMKRTSLGYIISRLTFVFSDLVIANSEVGLNAHNLKINAKNKYIYNGYDLSRTKISKSIEQIKAELGLNEQFVVGMIGNFLNAKDHQTFIAAMQNILQKRKDICVIFIGEGPTLESMKNLIQEENLMHFKFLGKITKVEEYINVFDIQCLICNTRGHAEGISNAIIEGMAMGKAIIATDSGGNKEIVQDGITGYLVKPFDIMELAGKLEFLIENEIVRYSFGDKGKSRIQNHFSLKIFVTNFTNLYREMALLHE